MRYWSGGWLFFCQGGDAAEHIHHHLAALRLRRGFASCRQTGTLAGMNYFAYGSNLSLRRLRQRVPGVVPLGVWRLQYHDLRFHKVGRDGSGKCDAHYTGIELNYTLGVLYEIGPAEKRILDRIEGLGFGYDEQKVALSHESGSRCEALTYTATHVEEDLSPYDWYRHHVLTGACEAGLHSRYIQRIEAVATIADPDALRAQREFSIHL